MLVAGTLESGRVLPVAFPVLFERCAATGEVGLLKVIKIRSEGKRNKRVTLELS